MQEMNEMKKLFQQMKDLIPRLNVPQHLLSTERVPHPPPLIFDDAITSQPSVSVHEEGNDAENLDQYIISTLFSYIYGNDILIWLGLCLMFG